MNQLIKQIQSDHTEHPEQFNSNEALPISVFKAKTELDEQSSTGLNGQFIHSQLLIECLIRMKPTSNEKQELADFCKEEYKDNPDQLEIVKEFERDYTLDRSLWWYTRDSFLYRLLNKALRVQNIDLLYLFRFFIRDLRNALEQHKCSSVMSSYRAQRMLREEIDTLRKSVGEFISMNSFFSTSINRNEARRFWQFETVQDDIEEVFFEITSNPNLDNIKPFADITELSFYPKEKEVLFMAGSIFRLSDIRQNTDGVWIIQMTLCSENDNKLQTLLQYLKQELGSDETNLLSFSNTLYQMGRLDHAEKYAQLYLDSLSANHQHITNCYQVFGNIADKRGECDVSLRWYQKALKMEMEKEKTPVSAVYSLLNCISSIYRKRGEYTLALKCYEKALEIGVKHYGKNHPNIAMCLTNIGTVCHQDKNYEKALYFHQKALSICEKYLPADHSDIGVLHNNIGTVYQGLGNFDEALKHYNIDLQIVRKALPPHHPNIAVSLENIGLVYAAKGDFETSLQYLYEASDIFRKTLSLTHQSVIKIDQSIQRVRSKKK